MARIVETDSIIRGLMSPEDVIHRGAGDDIIDGTDGDDVIADDGGSNVIRGHGGNDKITLSDYIWDGTAQAGTVTTNIIDAGSGNDQVIVGSHGTGTLSIDLGEGQDVLHLDAVNALTTMTLGAGPDWVTFGYAMGAQLKVGQLHNVITDFTAGAGGDMLDLGWLIQGAYSNSPVPSGNLFASGYLTLVQDGADTIVRLDFDGNGSGHSDAYLRDIVRLQNVTASQLTAENFAGYDPHGGPLVPPTVYGTEGNDEIDVGVTGGHYYGLGGNDIMVGGIADDVLDGGTGNDQISGGTGNDWLQGGDGNDILSDDLGDDRLDGGAGNDIITIDRTSYDENIAHHNMIAINGGDGDDRVSVGIHHAQYTAPMTATFAIDLGTGNDYLYLDTNHAGGTITLGAGQDRVELGELYFNDNNPTPIVIADFVAGAAGDTLDLGGVLFAAPGWDRVSNPFSTGHLRLVQQGGDTVVAFDYDGTGGDDSLQVLFRLSNVDSSTLTSANFGGYDPHSAAIVSVVTTGTSGDDTIWGGAGNDQLAGNDGQDVIVGGFGNDTISGGNGDDTIEGGYGDDVLTGGAGNDLVRDLHGGNDSLSGGDGNDTIIVNHRYFQDTYNTITIDAGTGADTVDFTSSTDGKLVVDLGIGDDAITFHSPPRGGTVLTLGSGNDVIALDPMLASQARGTITVTDFAAGDGGDRLLDWLGYARNVLSTPDANPFATGGAKLVQVGADTQLQLLNSFGTVLNVAMIFANTSVGSFTSYNFGVDITAHPASTGDTMTGTAGNDVLVGTAGADIISGLAGDDQISGGGGNDILHGGTGNNTLNGDDGNDTLDADNGNNILNGGAGNDIITGHVQDIISGGAGNDKITLVDGFSGAPAFYGSIDAGDGDDTLEILRIGESGNYVINAGAGDDHVLMHAMTGDIALSLGAGHDTVELAAYFAAINRSVLTITDFQTGAGGDTVDLSQFLTMALAAWAQNKNPFELGYTELRQVGSDVVLYFNVEGGEGANSAPIMRFKGTTVAQFTADNFSGDDPTAIPNTAQALKNDLTIAAGTIATATDTTPWTGVRAHYVDLSSDGHLQFINHGTLNTLGTTPIGALTGFYTDPFAGTRLDALFENASDGRFIVHSSWVDESGDVTNGSGYGFYSPSTQTVRFQNDGYFEVSLASGTAIGVLTGYTSPSLAFNNVNNGTMLVTSPYDAIGVQFAGYSGTFTNNGTLTVHGGDYAIGIYSDQYIQNGIVNNGTITVSTDPESPYASIGIMLDEESIGGPFVHVNTGTINADIAFYVREPIPAYGIADTLLNSGHINGTVYLNDGNDSIINTGSMSGRTMLGRGDDHYDGTAGTHSGSIEGGAGNDVLLGGAGAENFFGDGGGDLIVAGGGDDYVDGGPGSDLLDGGDGFDTLSYLESLGSVSLDMETGIATTITEVDYFRHFEQVIGSRGNDMISGSSLGDVLLGAGGDDVIDGRFGDDVILGNKGNDILTGGAGNDRFLFESGDGRDQITDFGPGDRIEIYGFTAAQSIVQTGADVLITLSASDSILVRNATVASLTAAKLSFTAGPLDITLPDIADDVIQTGDDLVIGAGVSFFLTDTSPLAVQGQAPSSAAVLLDGTGSGTGIWNSGSVILHTVGSAATAIGMTTAPALAAAETRVINRVGGLIDVTAAASDAIGISQIDSIYNQGTIHVVSETGNATGASGIYTLGDFVNSGTISVSAGATAIGVVQGIANSKGPNHYFNAGAVTVHGGAASIGYEVQFVANQFEEQPVFVNTGSISVTDGTSILDSIGLHILEGANSTIWNSGSITADFALQIDKAGSFSPYANYLTTTYNSGQLNGLVDLSTYADLLVNTGAINGAVNMGGGNDIYDGRQGALNGSVDGYDGNDILLAGAGSQHLFGGFGDDVLSGGAGADQLTGGQGRDTFRYETGFGADVITDFENGAAHDFIAIAGYTSFQSLTQSGSDVLITFSATDTLLVKNAMVADVNAALGFGAAAIAGHIVPAAPIAPLPMSEPPAQPNVGLVFPAIIGTENADHLVGGSGPDDLRGLGGNDILDGLGGADRMYGGTGNDEFHTDRPDDLVFENANEGTDTVISTAGYYLYANIENLTLAASAGDIFGVGNELANIITGNDGSNLLIAGAGDDVVHGGVGADSLFGQDGNDHLFGDAGIDYLVGGNGDDVLDGGTEADALYGQDGNDTLYGGTDFQTDILVGGNGNDVLHGDSGLGDYDLMDGGAGDDAYYVDTPADLTFEAVGGGIDTVYANISGAGYYLYANVENLVLQGTTPYGVGNELDNHLTGNDVANYLLGGAGNDVLNGKGGNDVLFGESGADTFVFEHGTGGDVIGDFAPGTDKIDLSAFGFANYQVVANSMHEVNGTTAIDLGGGDFIVLNGVGNAALHAGDFILAGSSQAMQQAAIVSGTPDTGTPFDHDLGHMHVGGALIVAADPLVFA